MPPSPQIGAPGPLGQLPYTGGDPDNDDFVIEVSPSNGVFLPDVGFVSAYGHNAGPNATGKDVIILYAGSFQITPNASGKFDAPQRLTPFVLDQIALPGPTPPISEMQKAWWDSEAACASVAMLLFHEVLHSKIPNIGAVGKGGLSCAHRAIHYTEAKEACARAESLANCLDGNTDNEDCPELLDPDPETGEAETEADYRDRLKELIAGYCGSYLVGKNWFDEDDEKADSICCFSPSPPNNCNLEPYTNPCPGALQTPPGSGEALQGCSACPEGAGGI